MRKIGMLFVLALLVVGACTTKVDNKGTPQGNGGQQIGNPASKFCLDNGGKLDIVTAPDGSQSGICTLSDGTTCDEWSYFEGKCPQEKTCGECPLFMPPGPEFCKDGTVIPGTTDECGCQMPPTCQTGEPVACPADAKLCPDGSAVGREGPNCEFSPCPGEGDDGASGTMPEGKLAANPCPEGERPQACTMEYMPVCGWFNQDVQCITYPCAATYGNKCTACADEKVDYWTAGECPNPDDLAKA